MGVRDRSAADIEELPIDELAVEILHDLVETRAWNEDSWIIERQQYERWQFGMLRAAAEAFAWLRAKGLIARTPSNEQSATGSIFVTRLGHRIIAEGLPVLRASERLQLDLHPRLERPVRSQFLLGDYETACFVAMKQVEVRVRQLADAPDSMIGTRLMHEAFKETGRLADGSMDPGEHVARMELFAGAIGLFKNPSSHREVHFEDPIEAAEVILFADLLMRILDRIAADQSNASAASEK